MSPSPLVSILINNYNYGRFLREAIDSALNQTYTNTEVIVVDDGSTDESRKVIAEYYDRITHVFKDNGGQGSAFNAGINRCRGDVICFLDSDDYFVPNKVEAVVTWYQSWGGHLTPCMAYHPLRIVNTEGRETGECLPKSPHKVPENLYLYARKYKFIPFAASPTSGLVVNKLLAQRIFPIPEQHSRVSADDFIVRAALLIGSVVPLSSVLGAYRVHSSNKWFNSKPPKSREFMLELESYLNLTLRGEGLEPVIDFFDSFFSAAYCTSRRDLIRVAQKSMRHHFDAVTFRFFVASILRILLRKNLATIGH